MYTSYHQVLRQENHENKQVREIPIKDAAGNDRLLVDIVNQHNHYLQNDVITPTLKRKIGKPISEIQGAYLATIKSTHHDGEAYGIK